MFECMPLILISAIFFCFFLFYLFLLFITLCFIIKQSIKINIFKFKFLCIPFFNNNTLISKLGARDPLVYTHPIISIRFFKKFEKGNGH